MREYRRRKGSLIWHFCENCSDYPTKNYVNVSLMNLPNHGEICPECEKKSELSNCN